MKIKETALFILVTFIFSSFTPGTALGEDFWDNSLKAVPVLVVLPPDFNDYHWTILERYFTDLDAEMEVAALRTDTMGAATNPRVRVTPTIRLDEVNPRDYEIVAFVGGPGLEDYVAAPLFTDVARGAVGAGKFVAGVENVAALFAYAGIVEDRRITGSKSAKSAVEAAGGKFIHKARMFADGPVVTGNKEVAIKRVARKVIRLYLGIKSGGSRAVTSK